MVTDKQIEEAAQGYSDATYGTLNTDPMVIDAFKQGTAWAQQELVKTLWHDAKEEEPFSPQSKILIEYRDDYFYSCRNSSKRFVDWETFVGEEKVRRWLYIDDLKGGEK